MLKHQEKEKSIKVNGDESDVPMTFHKQFIGFWQPQKAGLNKHTGKSCKHKIHNIHKITSLEMI